MIELFSDIISDYTLRSVVFGTLILGAVSGALGAFAVLRRQSLLGDTISHAALPGIALAFLLSGTKAPLTLLLGAAIAGWLGNILILAIVRRTKIKEDSAQGVVLSAFFGVGLVLLGFIQRNSPGEKSGLNSFLFGQAATLMTEDIITMGILGIISILVVILFWKEFKLLIFNREYGDTLGFSSRLLEIILTSLIVISIVIGLQTVGVVLMSAMIVIPAAAARQWTNKLGIMIIVSGLFGGAAGVSGAMLSSRITKLSTGPTVVVVLVGIALISILLGKERGLLQRQLQHLRNKRVFAADQLLGELYMLAQKHSNPFHPHALKTIQAARYPRSADEVEPALNALADRGLVAGSGKGEWCLTEAGLKQAEKRMTPGGKHD